MEKTHRLQQSCCSAKRTILFRPYLIRGIISAIHLDLPVTVLAIVRSRFGGLISSLSTLDSVANGKPLSTDKDQLIHLSELLINPVDPTCECKINHDVFPVSTYSTMVSLVIVFLITDYLRYKIIIILQAVCMIISFLMLIYGRGVFQMQIEEIFYGVHMAGEVAYFTYIYAKVDKERFQEVTSYARSAYLVGKCFCGIVAQTAVYFNLTSFQGLLWITVASEVVALMWAIMLPSVDRSMYFHRQACQDKYDVEDLKRPVRHDCNTVVRLIWNDLVVAFTNPYVCKWALWWALATCGFNMAANYCQVLWQVVRQEGWSTGVQYNGAVETAYTLLGALGSMAVGRVQLDWCRSGEPMLAVCSLVIAALLYLSSSTYYELVAYVTFVLLTVIYQTVITVANSEVAKHINRESYGLIFGITTFAVNVVRSVFTYFALQVYRLDIRVQFEVYAIYFAILGIFFVLVVISKALR